MYGQKLYFNTVATILSCLPPRFHVVPLPHIHSPQSCIFAIRIIFLQGKHNSLCSSLLRTALQLPPELCCGVDLSLQGLAASLLRALLPPLQPPPSPLLTSSNSCSSRSRVCCCSRQLCSLAYYICLGLDSFFFFFF